MYLTEEPLDITALLASVQSAERGGVACFLGTVRNHHQGREVVRLEYSAYAPMVEVECARIVAESQARWDVKVALQHRIGRLEIGDAAVAVAAASAHRDEAFLACRHVIEELKLRVPIWKREYYADGTVEWVEAGKRVSGEEGKQEAVSAGASDSSRRPAARIHAVPE
ncbi:MAG TPA: molybdenum cofactor biosynthesis protein MoaE [Gemmatimonadales bacterium]|nr:molybdenum cofactor biosynthesis protein MoaE [Gemmatimonadales bacterium]